MTSRVGLLMCTIALHSLISEPSEKSYNGTSLSTNSVQQFSFPPNNTPVTKVYVFGKPVYIRQPFVLPLRSIKNQRASIPVVSDEATFALDTEENLNSRVGHSYTKDKLVNQFYRDTYSNRYNPPEQRIEVPYEPATPESTVYTLPKPNYPLPQCYTNDSGFMCCNAKLERLMKDVFDELTSNKEWITCNVQRIANTLQNRTQSAFKTDFEALAGLGDFASKTHFYSDLICKIEVQGRFLLSYATPNRHQAPDCPVCTETSSTAYI